MTLTKMVSSLMPSLQNRAIRLRLYSNFINPRVVVQWMSPKTTMHTNLALNVLWQDIIGLHLHSPKFKRTRGNNLIAGSSGKTLIILMGLPWVNKSYRYYYHQLICSFLSFLYRATARALCILLPILGLTWIAGTITSFTQSDAVICFQYIFIICFSLQVWKRKPFNMAHFVPSGVASRRSSVTRNFMTNQTLNLKWSGVMFVKCTPLTAKVSGPVYPTLHGKPTTNLRTIASRLPCSVLTHPSNKG